MSSLQFPCCHVFIACSLDGFIARENGSLDWLPGSGEGSQSPESPSQDSNTPDQNDTLSRLGPDHDDGDNGQDDGGYMEFMSSMDAILMGRKTFEKVSSFSPWPYDKPVYIMTRNEYYSISESLQKNRVSICHEPIMDVLAELSREGLRHAYVDGGNLITECLRLGLISTLTITTIPVLIGNGIRLFGELPKDVRLSLESVKFHKRGHRYHQCKYSIERTSVV